MFKKIIISIMCSLFVLPVLAMEFEQVKIFYNEEIESQMSYVTKTITECLPKGDFYTISKTCEQAYKKPKNGDYKAIKQYNDMVLAFAIQCNLANYELSKQEKYAKKAYKLSNRAINDKTTQIYPIQVNILMASYKPNLKQMVKAFDLYREKDLNKAMAFYPLYEDLYNRGVEIKKEKQDIRNQKIRNAFYLTMIGIAAGCSGYAQGYNNYYSQNNTTKIKYPTTYNATSRQVGNTTYTTIQGY